MKQSEFTMCVAQDGMDVALAAALSEVYTHMADNAGRPWRISDDGGSELLEQPQVDQEVAALCRLYGHTKNWTRGLARKVSRRIAMTAPEMALPCDDDVPF